MLDVLDTSALRVGIEVTGERLCDASCGEDAPFDLELRHLERVGGELSDVLTR